MRQLTGLAAEGRLTVAFTSAVTGRGDVLRVALAGEIDLGVHEQVRAILGDALSAAPHTVELDLWQLTFIDSRGVGVLVGAHRAARAVGCTITIRRLQPYVADVLRSLGVFDLLCPGLTEAGQG